MRIHVHMSCPSRSGKDFSNGPMSEFVFPQRVCFAGESVLCPADALSICGHTKNLLSLYTSAAHRFLVTGLRFLGGEDRAP